MFRAAAGNVDRMKVLIAAKASVEQRNLDGCTPIYIAAGHGQTECMKLLLGVKADVDKAADNGLNYSDMYCSRARVNRVYETASWCESRCGQSKR